MTFGVPLFLLAVLAGFIPVLLHLIHRQQAPLQPFSTLRFLKLSVQRTRKRKYLHDLLLLLLRIAGLVLIAVALARPTIRQLGGLFGGRGAAVVIVLDNSASMMATDQAHARWPLAQQAAERVMDRLTDGDALALLLTAGPPQAAWERLQFDHDQARQALASAQPTFTRADVAARLEQARRLLAAAPAANKEIVVISDLQANGWESLATPPATADDAPQIPVVLVDARDTPLPNVGLERVDLRAILPVTQMPLEATVQVLGDPSVNQQRHVELYIDGRKLQVSPTLNIAAGERIAHRFTFTIAEPGVHAGEIRLLGEDGCVGDDRQFFAVTLEPTIRVAVAKTRNHEIPFLDDGYYLERALRPSDEGWSISTRTLTPAALASEPLSSFVAIFCVNLPAPEAETAQRLRDYAHDGGHIVWLSGDQVVAGPYNVMNSLQHNELIPASLGAPRTRSPERPDGWRIGLLDADHPATAPFAAMATLYQSVIVSKHLALTPTNGARILACLDDGEPLLVEQPLGAGSVLFCGLSASVDWSNLPLRPLFVPLISSLTFALAERHQAPATLVAGAPLLIPTGGRHPVTTAQVTSPAGSTVRLDPPAGSRADLRYEDTQAIGVYRIAAQAPPQSIDYAVAVNVDPAEVVPEYLAAGTLRQRFGNTPLLVASSLAELDQHLASLRHGESLMEWLLLGVLIVLVAETFVANRRLGTEASEPSQTPSTPRTRTARSVREHRLARP